MATTIQYLCKIIDKILARFKNIKKQSLHTNNCILLINWELLDSFILHKSMAFKLKHKEIKKNLELLKSNSFKVSKQAKQS